MILFPNQILPPKLQTRVERDTQLLRAKARTQSPEAIAASTDFIKFREYVCGHKTYPHQLEWHKILNTGESNRFLKGIAGKDTCLLAPRNSAKSTFLLQWVAWVIGTHVNAGISLKILYISYVVDTASSKSRQIKAIIESEVYREVFPRVRKSLTKWGEKEWSIDFGYAGLRTIDEVYTLACSGLGGAVNSRRTHLAVFDDVLKGTNEAKNRRIQDRMVENYNNVIYYTKHEGARFICLGTRFASHDIYEKIFVRPAWDVITQSALLVDQEGQEYSFCEPSNVPGEQGLGVSLATLQKERETDLESFLLQRQNAIPEQSFQGIQPHLIKYGWLPAEFERLIIGLDLASSMTGDHSAFVVLGVANDRIYVTDCYQERIQGNMRKIDLLYDLWATRKDTCRNAPILAVDANRYSVDFRQDLIDYLNELQGREKFKNLQIDPVKSQRGEKIDRLMSHSLLFQKGRVLFNRTLAGESNPNILIKQITDFNPIDSNDLMDALEVGLFIARDYIKSEITFAG